MRPAGIRVRGRRSTPGRYFKVAEPGRGWGGTDITDPLTIIERIDPQAAWPGMRLLMVSTTGEDAEWYELDQQLRPQKAPMPAAVRCATWFSKPRGIAYAEFYRAVPATAIAAGASLWERQMNLGPALECCLLAEDPLAVDGALDIAVVPLTLVYAPD